MSIAQATAMLPAVRDHLAALTRAAEGDSNDAEITAAHELAGTVQGLLLVLDDLAAVQPIPELLHVDVPYGEDDPQHDLEQHTLKGLQCPHVGCGHITATGDDDGVIVVDRSEERWSHFGYDGANIVGNYADRPDFHGVGYLCGECEQPVTLPAGVTEQGV